MVIGIIRGYPWKELSSETFSFVGDIFGSLLLYMLVGPTISVWMASGTIPTLMIYGGRIMTPAMYLPAAYLIMFITTIFMGSAVASVGTLGIALAGIGLAEGYPIWLCASAIGCGGCVGAACSPMLAINLVSVGLAGAEPGDLLHWVLPRILPPALVSLALYAAVGLMMHPSQAGEGFAGFAALEQAIPPGALSLLPLLAVAILLFKGVPSMIVFFAVILLSCIISVSSGNVSLTELPDIIVSGYRYAGSDAWLASLLNRGGMMSTISLTYTVLLAMLFGGSLKASGCLDTVMKTISSHVKTGEGMRRATMACTIATIFVTSSATLGTTLSGALFAERMRESGVDPRAMTETLSPAAALVCMLIPWSPTGVAIVNFLDLPMSEPSSLLYIPFAFCSYLGPLWLLRKPRLEPRAIRA